MFRFTKSIWKLSLISSITLSSFSAMALTHQQRKELYNKGTITVFDDEGKVKGHYEVAYAPGSDAVYEDTKAAWRGSADLFRELGEGGFWKDSVGSQFFKGIGYIEKYTKTDGYEKIAGSWDRTREKNREKNGIFSIFSKTFNWIKFGGKTILRAGRGLVSVPLGLGYALVAPAARIVYQPVMAGTRAVTTGTLVPAVRYAYNGAVWVVSSPQDLPSRDSIFIKFVPA